MRSDIQIWEKCLFTTEKNYRNVLIVAVIIYGFGIAMRDQRIDRSATTTDEKKNSTMKSNATQCKRDTSSHN